MADSIRPINDNYHYGSENSGPKISGQAGPTVLAKQEIA